MFRCPCCRGSMPTNDPNDANWVTGGQVVCSRVCYDEFLPMERRWNYGEYEFPLHLEPG
jgi:hypothetical protein